MVMVAVLAMGGLSQASWAETASVPVLSSVPTPEVKPEKTAQEAVAEKKPPSAQPIEITADGSLEWNRNDQTYVALGNAIATQADTSIYGQKLVADYRNDENDEVEVWKMTAIDDVKIAAPEGTAYGDLAVYHVGEGRAEMTGEALKMESPDQVMTAKDRFEYFTNEDRFTATGDVVIIRGEDTLKSDQVSAFFKNDAAGDRVLDRLVADGNVVIITPQETLYGDAGSYDPQSESAELTGNVQINRGPNVLTGSYATVDLKTNISRLYGAPRSAQNDAHGNTQQKQRVRGVFFPEN